MASQATAYQGVLYFNYQKFGWEERYPVAAIDYPSAIAALIPLALYGIAIRAAGVQLVWARCSNMDRPRDGKAIITYPITAPGYQPYSTPYVFAADRNPNVVNDCLNFRTETPTGQWANRQIRGLEDYILSDQALYPTSQTLVSNTPGTALPAIDDTLTWLTAMQAFLMLIRDVSVRVKKIPGSPPTYDVTPWSRIMYRGVSTRQTGRPFGMRRGRVPARVITH